MDADTGIVVEPEVLPEDVYPFCLVEQGEVKGSCASFHTRTKIGMNTIVVFWLTFRNRTCS